MDDRKEAQAAQPGLVRQSRQRRLPASQLDQEPGLSGRHVRRPPGHRHLQYLERADAVQRALPRAGGVREARRLRSRRISARVPGDVARRNAAASRPRCCSAISPAWTSRNPFAAIPWTASCCSWAATRPRPSLLMGAASCDLPTIGISGGPMLTGISAASRSARAPACGRCPRTCAADA